MHFCPSIVLKPAPKIRDKTGPAMPVQDGLAGRPSSSVMRLRIKINCPKLPSPLSRGCTRSAPTNASGEDVLPTTTHASVREPVQVRLQSESGGEVLGDPLEHILNRRGVALDSYLHLPTLGKAFKVARLMWFGILSPRDDEFLLCVFYVCS